MDSQIKEWITKIEGQPIPVMEHTIQEMAKLCSEENTPIKKLVHCIEQDPGLTVQMLRTCNEKGKNSLQREVASVQQALMLLGTQQAGIMAKQLPVLKTNSQDPQQNQVMRTFCRAYHAANQAVKWAEHRHDMTPDEVYAATLLHFLGEIVLAMYAPEKLLEAFKLRREKTIASEEAQYIVLGFTLDQLSFALCQAWQLPELVIDALRAENAQHPRAYGIMLAVQLARGATIDWYSDKTLSIQKQAAEWLEMDIDIISREAHQLAVMVARDVEYYGVRQSAALLPLIIEQAPVHRLDAHQAEVCLTPSIQALREALQKLQQAVADKKDRHELIQISLEGMHDGIGLNRVVFARYHPESNMLTAEAVVGAENNPVFNRFEVKLDQSNLFMHLLDKIQGVCINDDNRSKYWPMVPANFQKLIGTNSFAAMSIFVNNKVEGIVYADRHNNACQIDNHSYTYFKKLCGTLTQALSY